MEIKQHVTELLNNQWVQEKKKKEITRVIKMHLEWIKLEKQKYQNWEDATKAVLLKKLEKEKQSQKLVGGK